MVVFGLALVGWEETLRSVVAIFGYWARWGFISKNGSFTRFNRHGGGPNMWRRKNGLISFLLMDWLPCVFETRG